jgi:hypothetical protein
VTWAYATTLAPQISRAIGIGGRAGDNVTWGSALMFTGACYDAILEFSGATLVDGGVADAAIRLAQEMPIDFTGNLTSAGQNRHTLRYTNAGSGFGRLSYQVSGAEQFACEDIGIFVVGNDTTSTAVLQLDSAAGASRQLRFTTASALRWGILTGTTAETGSSAGSDFTIERYQDNGTPAAALTITRATGAITLGTIPPQAANDAAAAALVPPVGIGGLYRNGSALQVRVA